MESTADGGDEYLRAHEQTLRVPGLVVVMQAGKPSMATLPVSKQGVELGYFGKYVVSNFPHYLTLSLSAFDALWLFFAIGAAYRVSRRR